MLTKRVIPCLDVRNGRVTKGVKFKNNVDLGDPVEMAVRYSDGGADELVFYDITASAERRPIDIGMVEAVAKAIRIPFAVGGGISSVEDMERVILAGAEKISVNSLAVRNPDIIAEGAKAFGAQCIVLGMDPVKSDKTASGYEITTRGFREFTGMDAVEWAKRAADAIAKPAAWLARKSGGGFMARTFPCAIAEGDVRESALPRDVADVSDGYSFPFESAGVMIGGEVRTARVVPAKEPATPIRAVLVGDAPASLVLRGERLEKFRYLKGAKRISRTAANGHEYTFSEGAIPFPDPVDAPARTMLTSEGTTNRSTHVVADPRTGALRLLAPVEAERLQGFDDDWTREMPERMRYFCMGNALVVPMVTRMARTLAGIVAKEP